MNIPEWLTKLLKHNILILTFLARQWSLLACLALSVAVSLNETLFQIFGAIVYTPALVLTSAFIAALTSHLFFRKTIDLYIHSDGFMGDFWALAPDERMKYSFRTLWVLFAVAGFIAGMLAK